MYTIKRKKNKETGDEFLSLERVIFSFHPSVKDVVKFDYIFTREYARYEYFRNCVVAEFSADDAKVADAMERKDMLSSAYFQDVKLEYAEAVQQATYLLDCPTSMLQLMVATLDAHGVLFGGYSRSCIKDGKEEPARLLPVKGKGILWNLQDLQSSTKEAVCNFLDGSISMDAAVQEVKALFNSACERIVNNAEADDYMKFFRFSAKEKETRKFLASLVGTFKITRANMLRADSPLQNAEKFEKYFLRWVVTDHKEVTTQTSGKVSANSFISQILRDKETLQKAQEKSKKNKEKVESLLEAKTAETK